MKFTRLRLKNFKCFESVDLELNAGATVIHGVNGSGKSSLLEACFFALYGSDSLPSGRTLDSIITKGKSETEVELWFEHDGHQYQLERSLRHTDSQTIHDASLKTPSKELTSVTDVEAEINNALRMSANDFLNCAYVRQGDITRLLTANPEERQRIIDDLLQLGRLETYRERMNKARRGVARVKRDREAKLEDIGDEIERLEEQNLDETYASISEEITETKAELEELQTKLETAESKREEAIAELEEHQEQKKELEERKEQLESARSDHQEAVKRVDDLESQIETAKSSLNEAQETLSEFISQLDLSLEKGFAPGDSPAECEEARSQIENYRESLSDQIDEIAEEVSDLRETAQDAAAEAHRLADTADTYESQVREYEERIQNLEEELDEKRQTLNEKQDESYELKSEIADLKERFEAEIVPDDIGFGDAATFQKRLESDLERIRSEIHDLETEYTTLTQQIEHAERLLEEGNCPECGQDVSEAPEVATIDEDRQRKSELEAALDSKRSEKENITERLETAKTLRETENRVENLRVKLGSVQETIDNLEVDISQTEDEIAELEATAADKREQVEEQREKSQEKKQERDKLLSQVETLQTEIDNLEDERKGVDAAVEALDSIEAKLTSIQNLRQRLSDTEELVEDRQQKLEEIESKVEELEGSVEDARVESLQKQRDQAKSNIEEFSADIESLQDRLGDLRKRLGSIESKKEDLKRSKSRAKELAEKVEALEDLVDECAALEEMYSSLRTELRQRNVRQLEQLLNEIFELVYQNDAYSHIELSDEYELQMIEKSGEQLQPGELSGGEKAIFNLSLRCAIYQLLAEGIGGDAPLPPLILDEPTVHLDDEHINRISDLVTRMRQLGVDQTIVVSHQSEIVDTADERIEVLQNPSTNRSHLNVESKDLLAGL